MITSAIAVAVSIPIFSSVIVIHIIVIIRSHVGSIRDRYRTITLVHCTPCFRHGELCGFVRPRLVEDRPS